MKTVKLGDVARIDRSIATEDDCKTLPYIGLEHIEKETGHLINDFEAKPQNMLATNFCFTQKHVLYSKLRPYLNKVIVPNFSGVCTTEILPIMPLEKELNRTFLWAILLSPKFVNWASAQISGANLPRLDPNKLSEFLFTLPPLPEQQRIAAILQKADRLRSLRRYARQLSDSYLQSVFLEMFGDPATNPKKWEIIESEKIISNICYGTGSPPAYIEKGIPFIRATNVKNGTIQTDGLVFISENEARKISKCKLNKGDLLLVRSGVNSGDCALIPCPYQDAYAAYDLIIEMAYPYNYYFNFIINSGYGKNIINTLSRRAGQPHINSDQVKSIPLPLPSKALIGEFAKLIQENEKLKAQQIESEHQTEILFQSLLQQAFQGEL